MNTERVFWKDPVFLVCFDRSRRLKSEIYNEKIESVFQTDKRWLLEALAACGAFELAYKLWQRSKVKQDMLVSSEVDDLEAAVIAAQAQYDLESIRKDIQSIDDDSSLSSFIPGSKGDTAHKKLLKEQYLRKVPSSVSGVSLNDEESEVLISKQIESSSNADFLSFVQEFILKDAQQIEKETIKDLQLAMFSVITSIVNKPGKVSKSNAFFINCLETGIKHYLPFLGRFLGQSSSTLNHLRKEDNHKLNAVCYICANKLNRKREGSQCKQKENRKCYKQSLLETRAVPKEVRTFISKNICEKVGCGHRASLDFIHKVKGVNHQFCSKRCYMAYRKALQRKNN